MRLINADKIGLTDFEIAMCDGDYKKALKMLLDKISNQPTAYDIGKVVEELEEYLKSERNFNDIIDTGSEIKNPVVTRTLGRIEAFEKAIEIVKQGGVSDDFCEWKTEHIVVGVRRHMPNCCDKGLDMPVSTASGMKYCPYCGKKIKVAE